MRRSRIMKARPGGAVGTPTTSATSSSLLTKKKPLLHPVKATTTKKTAAPDNNEEDRTSASSSSSATAAKAPAKRRVGGGLGRRKPLGVLNNNNNATDEEKKTTTTTTKKKATATTTKSSTITSLADGVPPPSTTMKNGARSGHFTVLYTKRSNKKHKTFTDGVLSYEARVITLRSMEDKEIQKRTVGFDPWELQLSTQFELGNYEVELVAALTHDEVMSGRVFVKGGASGPATKAPPTVSKAAKAKGRFKASSSSSAAASAAAAEPVKKPLYDPFHPTALILNREGLDGDDMCQGSEVPVVVEPQLSQILRPHQREGVQFLYNCVMGVSTPEQYGVILGDEMGLGKTLQTITLIRTLLTQGPTGRASISKAIIVAPASLTGNWANEFRKWLGSHKIKPVVLTPTDSARKQQEMVSDFVRHRMSSVLIVGYELIRKHVKVLQKLSETLLVCDEGHRLKNAAGNQTIKALTSLNIKRRIIITGTPVQNDLQEFYAMCDFVCPGVFGSLQTFKNSFETPIVRSREPGCSEREREKGMARSMELSRMTGTFVLRRTAEVINKFLPSKHEMVVCCRLAPLQHELYRQYLRSKGIAQLMHSMNKSDLNPLMFITWLKKVCNHPALVYKQVAEEGAKEGAELHAALKAFGEEVYSVDSPVLTDSGKLLALQHILRETVRTPKDKIVVISNYTETLDVIGYLCTSMEIEYLRLDGATPANQRTTLVDRFNADYSTIPVFLLSAKAGGVGLNLVGANRLVLFDPDWNPATDLQVMARVWRQGQTRTTWIYRLLATGTIDEKIFQRQLRKQEVSDAVVDADHDTQRKFSKENLKELFVYREDTACETYDLLQKGDSEVKMGEDWTYHPQVADVEDTTIKGLSSDVVSFVMHKFTDTSEPEPMADIAAPLHDDDDDDDDGAEVEDIAMPPPPSASGSELMEEDLALMENGDGDDDGDDDDAMEEDGATEEKKKTTTKKPAATKKRARATTPKEKVATSAKKKVAADDDDDAEEAGYEAPAEMNGNEEKETDEAEAKPSPPKKLKRVSLKKRKSPVKTDATGGGDDEKPKKKKVATPRKRVKKSAAADSGDGEEKKKKKKTTTTPKKQKAAVGGDGAASKKKSSTPKRSRKKKEASEDEAEFSETSDDEDAWEKVVSKRSTKRYGASDDEDDDDDVYMPPVEDVGTRRSSRRAAQKPVNYAVDMDEDMMLALALAQEEEAAAYEEAVIVPAEEEEEEDADVEMDNNDDDDVAVIEPEAAVGNEEEEEEDAAAADAMDVDKDNDHNDDGGEEEEDDDEEEVVMKKAPRANKSIVLDDDEEEEEENDVVPVANGGGGDDEPEPTQGDDVGSEFDRKEAPLAPKEARRVDPEADDEAANDDDAEAEVEDE